MSVPVSRPNDACIVRLTSGAPSSISPAAAAWASSKAIALSICGSPNTLAYTNIRTPAARPTSIPRISSPRTSAERSIA